MYLGFIFWQALRIGRIVGLCMKITEILSIWKLLNDALPRRHSLPQFQRVFPAPKSLITCTIFLLLSIIIFNGKRLSHPINFWKKIENCQECIPIRHVSLRAREKRHNVERYL